MNRISDCNNSANQRWTLVKGSTSVKLAGSNFCLDGGSNPGNGAQAKVYTVSHLAQFKSSSEVELMVVLRRTRSSDMVLYR